MALILNIETAEEICSAGLARDGKLIDVQETKETRAHATTLTPFIESLMARNGLALSQLDAVAVSKGPGSYTGLRIGVSVAKGICYAADLPLIAVNTLEALVIPAAAQKDQYVQNGEPVYYCPMIDARRMEVYTTLYDEGFVQVEKIKAEILEPDFMIKYRQRAKVLMFGSGAAKFSRMNTSDNTIIIENIVPRAENMAPLAEKAFQAKNFENTAYFEPFYLKDFIPTIPKNKVL
jgi:tRNA threonylcarbamoyladenosine biosynthesis protein TsaB